MPFFWGDAAVDAYKFDCILLSRDIVLELIEYVQVVSEYNKLDFAFDKSLDILFDAFEFSLSRELVALVQGLAHSSEREEKYLIFFHPHSTLFFAFNGKRRRRENK